jgi:hypothetical protein
LPGFSCQEQIAHGTHRRALHLAQVLQLAMRYGQDGPPGDHPEQAVLTGVRKLTTASPTRSQTS